jgi:hypothetical protein
MKKFLLMVLILTMVMAGTAWADTYPAGTKIGWDAVTTDIESNVINPENIKYRIYLKSKDTGALSVLGETLDLTWIPALVGSGVFYAGVAAFGHIDGVPIPDTESDITWSDSTDLVAVPVPFGLSQWLKLQAPKGLRLVP